MDDASNRSNTLGQLRRNIAAAANYHQVIRFLRMKLDDERIAFEGTDASEYRRGRVSALRDLLRDLPNSGV